MGDAQYSRIGSAPALVQALNVVNEEKTSGKLSRKTEG